MRVIHLALFLIMLPFILNAEDEQKAKESTEPKVVAEKQAEPDKAVAETADQKGVDEAAEKVMAEEKPAPPPKPVFKKGSVGEIVNDPKLAFADFMDISPGFVKNFYKERDYSLVWIRNGDWSPRAKILLDALYDAEEEGLFPQDYEVSALPQEMGKKTDEQLNALDVKLTSAAMQYIVDVRYGRRELRKTNGDHRKGPEPSPKPHLIAGLKAKDFGGWLASLPPKRPEYQALKRLLATYQTREARSLPPIPAGKQLRFGDREERVRLIHEHLLTSGDLRTRPHDIYLYSVDTQAAIKSFQRRHNMRANGVLNPATRIAMNQPNGSLIHKIVLNMERWRWLPHQTSRKYILVNVPGFMLYGFDRDRLALESKIIVGNEYRQTPIFSAPMVNLKFNPTWSVPAKIAAKDILPQIQANPNFLNEFGMTVLDQSGRQINPYQVNWHAMSARNFPYRLRQMPGSTNALGKLRFTIDNPYAIFLHDTNAREKFNAQVRTLSSGCIRVQYPEKLAAFVMDDPQKWNPEMVKVAMRGTRTNIVNLPQKVDVHMVYATVFVDPKGQTHFYNDVYNRDHQMMRLLSMDQKWDFSEIYQPN